jgi:hypothetical protein
MLNAPFTPTACLTDIQTLNGIPSLNQVLNLVNRAALCITSRKVGVAHFSVRASSIRAE